MNGVGALLTSMLAAVAPGAEGNTMTKTKTLEVVIIHGSYGSPNENWFPWLADEVRKAGHRAVVPTFPTPEGQTLDTWLDRFKKEVGPVRSDMVLVGHSLGAGFILNLLERSDEPVAGSFLVSGFLGKLGLPDFDAVNETFVFREFDWERVRRHAGAVHVYHSDDDPYVPLGKGRDLAQHLGVELFVVHKAGHINAAAGFRTFPQLLTDLKALLERR